MMYANGGCMANSFGGALMEGVPVVMTAKDKVPEILMRMGKEKEALETLAKMGLVKIVIVPNEPSLPPNVKRIK